MSLCYLPQMFQVSPEVHQIHQNVIQITKPELCMVDETGSTRAGHVPTFFKSFCSVLERGPSAKLFRSCSSFLSFHYRSIPSHSVPFWVEERSSHSVPSLVEEWSHSSCSVLNQERFHPPVPFLVTNISIQDKSFIEKSLLKSSSRP